MQGAGAPPPAVDGGPARADRNVRARHHRQHDQRAAGPAVRAAAGRRQRSARGRLGTWRAGGARARAFRQGVPGRQRFDRRRDRDEDGAAGAGAARRRGADAVRRVRERLPRRNGRHAVRGRSGSLRRALSPALLPGAPGARLALSVGPRRSGLAGRGRRLARDRPRSRRRCRHARGDCLRAGPAGGRRHAALQPGSSAPPACLGRRARGVPDRRRDRGRNGTCRRDAGQPPGPRRATRRFTRLGCRLEGADGRCAAAVRRRDHRRDLRAVRCRLRRSARVLAFEHLHRQRAGGGGRKRGPRRVRRRGHPGSGRGPVRPPARGGGGAGGGASVPAQRARVRDDGRGRHPQRRRNRARSAAPNRLRRLSGGGSARGTAAPAR